MTSFRGLKGLDRKAIFWAKVDRKEGNKCWNWTDKLDKDGYGQFWLGTKFIRAHRYALELIRGCAISTEFYVLHLCDNPSCCNPAHLYEGTQADNMRDRAARGPKLPAIACAHPRFYEGEIWLIRKLKKVISRGKAVRYKFPESYVAKMFKVNQSVIHRIWNSEKYLTKEGTYA